MVRAGKLSVPLDGLRCIPTAAPGTVASNVSPKEHLRLERSLDLEGPYPRNLSFIPALASFIFSP